MPTTRLLLIAFFSTVAGAILPACFQASSQTTQPQSTATDEAILLNGTRIIGTLQGGKGPIQFASDAGKTWALDQLQQVRFSQKPCRPPSAPVCQRLMLNEVQWLSGELLSVDAELVRFRTWTGKELKVPRKNLFAVAHPADWHMLHREDFEKEPAGWKFAPADAVRTDVPFSGKKSLILDRPGQEAVWTLADPLTSGRASFFLRQSDKLKNLELRIDGLFRKGKEQRMVQMQLDGAKFTASKPAGLALDANPAWHLLQVEIGETTLRLSVDDFVLHSEPAAAGWVLTHVKFAVKSRDPSLPAVGFWSVDDAQLLRREPVLPWPRPLPDADAVWLAEGDQLFGTIARADAQSATLEARFGTRTIAWPALRGLVFQARQAPAKTAPAADAVTLWVAPAPGLPADRIAGTLLTVSQDTLVVRHETLGELTFDRTCCLKLVRSPKP